MSLVNGRRIGPYEIVAAIGAGGMGEVYRARDTRLHRDVAIKVLPGEVAADSERLARFRREAQVLASLNHPHIAAIYGVEDSDGVHALILELVEGPTLADRVAQGPIPLDEALPIAGQIADALEAAHELGIVHRDLKPANVKVRTDGTVKVLDFGLAKAMETGASFPGHDVTNSPTITSPAHNTTAGVILGTAAYMSPEQARGRPADRRSDIWAFGALLYEMLTGRRAFTGEDVSETIASVLKDAPDFSRLPPSTPSSVRRLIERCLERDSKMRLRDIGEARIELASIRAPAGPISSAVSAPMAAPTRKLVPPRPERRVVNIESSGDAVNETLRLIDEARHELCIYTRDLDPILLESEPALEALKHLAISGRGARIRIIIQDPRAVVAHGHRLLTLAQRMTSIFALRTPTQDNDLQYPSAFLLNDVYGYYFRVLGTRFEGEAVNYSPGRHAQLLEYFNQVWERSETSEDLRQLSL